MFGVRYFYPFRKRKNDVMLSRSEAALVREYELRRFTLRRSRSMTHPYSHQT